MICYDSAPYFTISASVAKRRLPLIYVICYDSVPYFPISASVAFIFYQSVNQWL
jgi:hypothetical protein